MYATPPHEARRIAASTPGSILLESAAPGAFSRSLLFTHPERWLEAHTLADIPRLLAELQAARTAGLYAAGFLSYECGYAFEPTACPHYTPQPNTLPLAAFGLYREPIPVESGPAAHTHAPQGLLALDLSLTSAHYAQAFAEVQRLIAAGDTYQLNLTLEARGFHASAAALYEHMLRAQPVAFAAMMRVGARTILSASPELFFHLRGRDILTRPMKGTAPRSADPAEDARNRDHLAVSEKDRAENVMIVDLLRNDLGRLAVPGSVRVDNLFAIEPLPTVFQMTSDVRATLRPDVDIPTLFRSLFPSGSIIGAPKVHAMRLLRGLEQRDRGIYTGAIGFIAPDEAVFSVAIRTAVVEGAEVRMGIGSGVVADSDATAEYRECLLKAAFLLDRSFGLIETLRWEAGRCALLDLHLARLEASAQTLGFPFDRANILTTLEQHAATLPNIAHKVRAVLERSGTLTVSSEPIPQEPARTIHRVAIAHEHTHSADPWLRHKTTRRHVYNNAFAHAQHHGLTDLLFFNEHGHLTEAAIHNVFLRQGNRWRTPPLSDGVLPGIYRQHLLATRPGIEEAHLTLDDLHSADELLLTNAVRGERRAVLVDTP